MKKSEMKEWLQNGVAQAQALMLDEVTSKAGDKAAKVASDNRRDSLAALMQSAANGLAAGELLCPVLDAVRTYLYVGADTKEQKGIAANKLTAARRLAERALKAAFPDSERDVTLRRENGEGKTFVASLAKEKADKATVLARQVAALFGVEESEVTATFATFRAMGEERATAKAKEVEQAARIAHEEQRRFLAAQITAFDARVGQIAEARGIDRMMAAGILHDCQQVDGAIYSHWLETAATA